MSRIHSVVFPKAVRGLRASHFFKRVKAAKKTRKDEHGKEDDWVLRYSLISKSTMTRGPSATSEGVCRSIREVLSLEDNRCPPSIFFTSRFAAVVSEWCGGK